MNLTAARRAALATVAVAALLATTGTPPAAAATDPPPDPSCEFTDETTCVGQQHIYLSLDPAAPTAGQEITATVTFAHWVYYYPPGADAPARKYLDNSLIGRSVSLQSKPAAATTWTDQDTENVLYPSETTRVVFHTRMPATATDWRALVDTGTSISAVTTTTPPTPTGTARFLSVRITRPESRTPFEATSTCIVGDRLRFTAQTQAQYTGGSWGIPPVGSTVTLQFKKKGTSRWTPVTTGRTGADGRVTINVTAKTSGEWRLILLKSASDRAAVQAFPRRPTMITATWPQQIYSTGFTVSVTIVMGNGERWPGRTPVQLQFRGSRSWTVLDRDPGTTPGAQVLRSPIGVPGTYRVIAPSIHKSTTVHYQPNWA